MQRDVMYSLLYPKTKTVIICRDKEDEIKTRDKYLDYISKNYFDELLGSSNETIEFENGSMIRFVHPTEGQEVIRGKRSEIPPLIDEFEHEMLMNCKTVDKLLKPFAEIGVEKK